MIQNGDTSSPAGGSRSRTVLIVDDDDSGLEFMAICLKRGRHDVFKAHSVREAREVILEEGVERFDCVLTDFRMPHETGLDLLKWLKTRDSALSVVLVTAYGEKQLVSASLRDGATDFLEKPVPLDQLNATVARVSERTAQARRLAKAGDGVRAAASIDPIFRSQSKPVAGNGLRFFLRNLHEVGGDFFDLFSLPDGRKLIIAADVAGHDVRAGFISAYFQGLVRGMLELGQPARKMIETMNRLLSEEWRGSSSASGGTVCIPTTIAVWAGVIDAEGKSLTSLNYGFGQHYLWMSDLALREYAIDSPALGIADGDAVAEREDTLEGCAAIYLFSDGVQELASRLDINPFAVVACVLTPERVRQSSLNEVQGDDILAMRISVNDDASLATGDYEPVIYDHYSGNEVDNIDHLQDVWRRSLRYALGDGVDDRLYDILLCCREGVLNALVHGCDRSQDKRCTFQIAYSAADRRLLARVDDPGRGHSFDPETRAQPGEPLEGDHLGLAVIARMADSYKITNEGSTLIFDFSVREVAAS